jgi:hypothetical protein
MNICNATAKWSMQDTKKNDRYEESITKTSEIIVKIFQ